MTMPLGLNLSFGVKRWLGGDAMAHVVRGELGCDRVQFSWDLVDPWWPTQTRERLIKDYAKGFRTAGITVDSTFGGVASYSYNHFLGPSPELRELGEMALTRAVDMTAELETTAMGMPFGSYSAADALDAARRADIYAEACERMVRVATHAKSRGLEQILIEPVPLSTEFPASARDALALMRDLDGNTDVPVRLLVDWGHAMFRPLFGEDATMDHWMETCGDHISAFHLQQTDGELDRHWSFTHDGIVTADALIAFASRYDLTDKPSYLEIIYPFETPDELVLSDMKACMKNVRQGLKVEASA